MIEVLNYYYENYTDDYGQKYIELSNLTMFKRSGLIHLLEKHFIEYDLMFNEMIQTKKRRVELEKQREKEKKDNIPLHFIEQFMTMSRQLNVQHNCPCCFEIIIMSNIILPKCCHMLCRGCYSKLLIKICPTCRNKI
uniref:RING-type domain-containing protein n=1 Tax=viral metagenome TaxID=1070528 RepID=A0A6C0EU40_9ZZZZ